MKLHLPSSLRKALLVCMSTAAAAVATLGTQAQAYREMPITTADNFYAGPFEFSFTVDSLPGEGYDILTAYYGNNNGSDHTVNVIRLEADGSLDMVRGKSLNPANPLDNTSVLTEIDRSTFKQDGSAYVLGAGTYTVVYNGLGNGSAAADLYRDGELVASFSGGQHNMSQGGKTTTMQYAYNSNYAPPTTTLSWAVAPDSSDASFDYAGQDWTYTPEGGTATSTGLIVGQSVEFGAGDVAKTVTVNRSVFVDAVSVKDNYTFNGTVAGAKVDASAVTVEAGKTLSLQGSGTLLGNLSGSLALKSTADWVVDNGATGVSSLSSFTMESGSSLEMKGNEYQFNGTIGGTGADIDFYGKKITIKDDTGIDIAGNFNVLNDTTLAADKGNNWAGAGPNIVDTMTIGAGKTLTITGTARFQVNSGGTLQLLDGSTINRTGVGAFYIKGEVNVAENATATFTTVDDIHFNYDNESNTVKGAFVLEDGSTLDLTAKSFQQHGTGSEIVLGENAVLNAKTTNGVFATDKMTLGSSSSAKLNTKGAVSVGTLTLASGASLVFNSVQGASTHTLSSVVVGGDASIDFDGTNIHQGQVNIASLTNAKNENNEPITGTLTLSSNSNTSQRTIFNLEGGSYEGKIKVDMVQSSGDRKLALNIKDSEVAKNAVIELASKGGAVALGIGASEVKVKGITGTTGTIYAGAQNYGEAKVFSADGKVEGHTLVVNTAGEDYATSAAIVGKKDGAGNLHLTKHGAGKQSFNGNNQLGNVKVTGGELSFGGATTMGNLTLEQDNTNSAGVTSRAVTFAANSTIGDIDAKTAGNFNFKLATGSTSTTYTAGTIKTTANNGMGFNMGIDSGVTVNAATFDNGWGMGTLTVDGELNLSGMLKFATGRGDGNRITGNGSISAASAEFGNIGTYNISVKQLTVEGGLNITSDGDTPQININSGSSVVVKGQLTQTTAGYWGGTPSLNIQGGDLELKNGGAVSYGVVNLSGGSLVQAGGTTTVSTDFSMTGGELKVTAGELKAGDKFSATGGKLNVAGGILSIGTGSVVTDGTTVAAAAQLSYGNGALSITGNNATADMGAVSFRMVEDEVVLAGGVADNALIALMEGASLKLENVTLGAGTQISGAAAIATVDADGSVSSTGNALTLADTTVQIAKSSTPIEVLSNPLSSDMALALDLSTDVKGIAVTASTFANVSLTGEMELNITGDLISELIQGDYKYVAITFEPSVTWSTETVTITGASFGNGQPAGGVVINNGTIYVSVPEPTTATLSLLALAALAARRRRK